MSIDSAIAIAWDVLKHLGVTIKRQFEYVMRSKRYADDLRKEVKKLRYEADRVQDAKEAAENNLLRIHEWVPEFLASAEKALTEAGDLLSNFEQASKTCCYGTFPDPNCRHTFSRMAKHHTDHIKNLVLDNRGREVSFRGPAPGNVAPLTQARREGKDVIPLTTAAATSSALMSMELQDGGIGKSRESIVQEIMATLADNSNSVVGVYGMGGVGKSTLVEEVKRRLSEEKLFDWVTMAIVSENPDINRIQREIAYDLDLDMKNEANANVGAKRLHKRLQEEVKAKKKVLIILDNIWEQLNLKSIGIPCGLDDKVTGCKLLLTSRDRDVLRRKMGCDRDFHLARLQEEEAKELFEGLVGEKVREDQFKSLVDEALHKCAGLPFLIIAMANNFKDAELSEWKDALNQIEMSTNKGLSGVINSMLQLSYNGFKGEDANEVKLLLRLCAVYGVSEPSLENLMRYGTGLGLFGEGRSIEDARNRLSSLIHTLQASSFLLHKGEDGFGIHDLVRGFVTSIASRDDPFLVLKDNDKSVAQLPRDKLKSCTAVCFPYVDMKELPKELDCSELQIFLLFTNNESLMVPDSLFASMKKLMVLNVTGIYLTRLPLSFRFLEKLHTLCLEGCLLENVAIIGDLKRLQILSFVKSKIQRLPKEIGQLVELRLLDLNYCSKLYIIDPSVLESLIKLEELYMERSFDQWNAVDQTPPTNASLIELNHMENLCTLDVSIPDPSMLPGDLNIQKLTKYKIQIGHFDIWRHRLWSREYKASRTLILRLNPPSDIFKKECIRTTLDRIDALLLDGLCGNEQSICALSQEGFPKLKHLQVQNNPSIHYILRYNFLIAFKALESLILKNLINLEKICQSHISSKSFSTLKVLQVESCDNMKVLFPPSVVRGLPKLEEIKIVSCKLMHGILEADDCGKVELHNLRVLILCDLPDIKNFLNAGSAHSSSTLDDKVSTQIAFFNGQQISIPSLESLTMERLPNMKEIWSDESPLELSNLRSLNLVRCKSLLKVISSQSLVKLRKLHNLCIRDCNSMQEIFDLDEPSAGEDLWALSELTTFELNQLGSLRHIWNKNPCGIVSLHNLKKLEVDHCDNLGFMFFPSTVKSLVQLRDLTVRYCKKMEAIIIEEEGLGLEALETSAFPMLTNLTLIHLKSLKCFSLRKCSQEARSQDSVKSHSAVLVNREIAFQRLEKLEINRLDSLEFIFFPSMVKSLTQLKELTISYCEKMEAIIMEEEGLGMETSEISTFPMLTDLRLQQLKSLTCFSRGKCAREGRGQDCVRSRASALFNHEVAFQILEKLEIIGLHSLEFIFFPSMVKSLTQLKKLTISDCEKTEAIIMEEEGLGMETSEISTFPMLTDLSLQRLKSLTCFSRGKCAREGRSQDRVRSRASALFNHEVAFPNLENLYIMDTDNIETIWHDQIPADSFSKLKLLSVNECKKLVNVIPSFILGRLLSLETLTAKACDSLEVVFKLQPLNPLDGNSVACSPLKELKLDYLSMLNYVWDKELYRHIKFQCLRSVTLQRCARLTSLFSTSIARDLIQLEELNINQCGIVELIEKEGLSELSINVEAIEGPSHELKVASSFPSYFQHMKTLDVSLCDGLSNMFTSTIVENLVGLTKLRISKCEILTEVISDEGGKEGHVVTFNQLKYMELDGLTGLRCFSSNEYTLMFPLLEDIIVNRCPQMKFFHKGQIEVPKLKGVKVGLNKGYEATKCQYFWKENLNTTIQNMLEEMATFAGTKYMRLFEFPELIGKWHGKLNPITSSWQLESLVVDKCPSFINAIPSRLMLVLERMTSLQVHDCEPLEEIFNLEGLKAVDCIQVLPRLQDLCLVNLPKLRQLWNKDLQGTMYFSSLWCLSIYRCSNLRHALIPSMTRCLPNLRHMEIQECDQMEGVILDEDEQGSTMEKITFPNLRRINLKYLPSLSSFLLWKNHTLECPILSTLSIAHCPKMRSLTWQSSMEIDNDTSSLFTPQVKFPQLRWMDLSHLDKLSRIWTNGPQETLTFDCLWEVKVENCRSLENLFPHWVAISLTKLDELRVESCGIEEIVTSRDDTPHSNTTQDLFPKLTSLVLHDMPRLKSFCPNLPTLNWSLLEELRVTHCDKLNMLSFAASMNSWAQRDDQQDLLDQEAHSSFERDFPNLERLLLVNNNIQMIQDGNFSDDMFNKLKALTLACFHDKKAAFPSIFLLERFQNLQSLEVFRSSFEDLFPNEGLVEERKHSVLENLRELKLNKLHNLKCVWREDSLVSKILQSIETFEVWDCPCLTTIFPTETSFQNLTNLVVKNSSGLIHLVTTSAVTNLVHLTYMTIIGCERMKEVVADDGNREGKVISFEKLIWLSLEHLPNLECFSSIPSCIFRFPSLWDIKVEECPKMKIFSKGTLSTPKLEDVSLFRYKWGGNWEKGDDLNTTIQKLAA